MDRLAGLYANQTLGNRRIHDPVNVPSLTVGLLNKSTATTVARALARAVPLAP